ncbi:MAG: hypothetical protein WC685_14890 [Methylobacter sp.]|jgi:hypothetical protein
MVVTHRINRAVHLLASPKALKVGTLGDISAYIELYWVKNSVHNIVE